MSQTLKIPYPQVSKQHKEKFMTYTTKISQNMKQELCGCGTAAEIAYMGHKSVCEEFQWMNERSSYEMLLAVLKKRKKATLCENFEQQHKRPRLQSPSGDGTNEDSSNPNQDDVNMDNPNTSTNPNPTTATNPLAVLAEVAQSPIPKFPT